MKIVNISESLSILAGGVQTTARGFANALACQGNDVTLICGVDEKPIEKISDKEKIKLAKLNKIVMWKFQYLVGLSKLLDQIKPDLVIQHGIWSPYVCQITNFCKKRNIPYAIVVHGMLDPYIVSKNYFQKWISLKLYQQNNLDSAVLLRALNEKEEGHINRITDNKVVVAHNGLNVDVNGYKQKKEKNKIVFLGRIDPKKGVLELIMAWLSLFEKNKLPSDASLKIAGWGADKEYIAACKKAGAGCSAIEFLGEVSGANKWNLLASCAGFILPSRGEGLPTTVLEAWASKCVVIITKECNFPQNLFEKCALMTECDIGKIEESLLKYFSLTDELLDKFAINGEKELANYSWDTSACKFLKAVKDYV